jgi:hypothetical protein
METVGIDFAVPPPRTYVTCAVSIKPVASPVGEASIRDLACVGRRRPRPSVDMRFSKVRDFGGSGPPRKPPTTPVGWVRRI